MTASTGSFRTPHHDRLQTTFLVLLPRIELLARPPRGPRSAPHRRPDDRRADAQRGAPAWSESRACFPEAARVPRRLAALYQRRHALHRANERGLLTGLVVTTDRSCLALAHR